MIFEHEIPNGSRLYFGELARKKRYLENIVATFFIDNDFDEIITPNFSYSQHQSIANNRQLIKINDASNNQIALRADSTLDVVRIISKRLGRATSHKKWFYIQPTFSYPSTETYQMGCEWIEYDNISDVINLNAKILDELQIDAMFQIANVKIPILISKILNIDINLFKNGEIRELLKLDIQWLTQLIHVSVANQLIQIIELVPEIIKNELKKLVDIASNIKYDNIIISPLYYGAWKYYDDIYYRIVKDNLTLAKGGGYQSNGICSLGFALYTDNLIKIV
jgi:histidyl-tRNA synthetase